MIIILLVKIFFSLFVTPVKRESVVLANDEPQFRCVQLHLQVFAMFVSRINFDFIIVAGLALIVEV